MAQGVVDVPAGQVVWVVSSETAQPPANALEEPAATGFLIAGTGAIIVEEMGSGEQTRLAGGEAMLTRAGEQELRAALGATASPYFSVEMQPAVADQKAPEGGYLGPAFTGPGARHDLDLVGVELGAAQSLNVPAGMGPTLVLVTAGSAEVATDKGEFIPLATGEAHAVPGPVTVTGYDGGASVAVAVIGPAVPRLAATAPPPAAEAPAASGEQVTEAQTAAPPADSEPEAEPTRERRRDRDATPEATSGVNADDPDGDGLTNAQEDELNTDPGLADTDGDGLNDGREVNEFGTLPLAVDSDGDGISDFDEFADQVLAGNATPAAGGEGQSSPPATLEPVMVDAPDGGETPTDVAEPVMEQPESSGGAGGGEGDLDSDGDGLTDGMEYEIGTDPFNPDSDADNATDGAEWNLGLTGPLNPDDDQDGKLDGDEINAGTNPNDAAS
jgi:hypothetical protein